MLRGISWPGRKKVRSASPARALRSHGGMGAPLSLGACALSTDRILEIATSFEGGRMASKHGVTKVEVRR